MSTISYALGLTMASNLKASGFQDVDPAQFAKALSDFFQQKECEMTIDEAHQIVAQHFAKVQEKQAEAKKQEGAAFLKKNLENPEVKSTASGLQYIIKKEGNGKRPSATDTVRCHYEGRLIDGSVFDSSFRRNQPIDFGVNQVIPGWVEALQLMSEGAKWKLFIPSDLGYGEHGAGDAIGPNETLIFDVELLQIL